MDAVNAVGARLELRHTALRRRMIDFTAAPSGPRQHHLRGAISRALMSALGAARGMPSPR